MKPTVDSRQPTALWRIAISGVLGGMLLVACVAPISAAQNPAPRTSHPARAVTKLPPVPLKTGPLALTLVYPSPTDVIDAGDSSFVFGQIGDGRATLMINGQEAVVARNGAFLAWIRIPSDTLVTLEFEAVRGSDTLRATNTVRRTVRFSPPTTGPWLDTLSVLPRGRVWWPKDEPLPITLRAAPGATVTVIANGTRIPLTSDPRIAELSWGTRAFETDTSKFTPSPVSDRYAGTLPITLLDRDPGPIIGPTLSDLLSIPSKLSIEVVLGADTVRWPWRLRGAALEGPPLPVRFDDDTAKKGDTDQLTVGRALPGGTYVYFFPTGTRAAVTARLNNELRVRLSSESTAWVAVGDAIPLGAGVPTSGATVSSVRLTRARDRVILRIPVSWRVPFRVNEEERRLTLDLFGARGDVNWIQYGAEDSLIQQVRWAQPTEDGVSLTIDLADRVWGYRTHWEGNDLILEIKRPPRLDRLRPLAGVKIAIDAGHPPVGATGPTGFREPEANLAVAKQLERMFRAAGATVLMTRKDSLPVDLWPRVRFADSANADLLVSIHNNALPDGVNPFTNNGTSVYYNQPRSLAWARPVEAALVRRLGLTELGVGRGDLALVRPTWMPAILCEGMFMMVPEQEAALRSLQGQRLYAQAVFDGTVAFLKDRARTQTGATRRP